MNRKIIFPIAVTLAFSTFPAAAAKVSGVTGTLIEFGFTPVKLKRASNHIYASCRLNEQSLDLAVDTGAQSTAVSAAKLASVMGSVKKEEGKAYGMLGQVATSLRRGEVNSFQVGPYNAGSHPVALWDFSRHARPTKGMSMDGLLGIDFLHRHQAVIDCFQMNLFLKPPGTPSRSAALAAGLRAGGCTEIPLQAVSDGLAVSTRINGKQGYLIVDTGAPYTILRENAIAELNLRRASAGFVFRRGGIYEKGLGDVSGRSRTRLGVAHFTSMELGGFSVPPQGVGVADLPTLTGRGGPGVFFGYLGADLLAYYVGIIDCHALKLFLRVDPVVEAERKKHQS